MLKKQLSQKRPAVSAALVNERVIHVINRRQQIRQRLPGTRPCFHNRVMPHLERVVYHFRHFQLRHAMLVPANHRSFQQPARPKHFPHFHLHGRRVCLFSLDFNQLRLSRVCPCVCLDRIIVARLPLPRTRVSFHLLQRNVLTLCNFRRYGRTKHF